MREKENRRLGFDMTLTCTRKGEIYRREERGERREERNKMGFNTPPQAGAWRSNMPSLDPMVSYAGPGRALVRMSAN